VRFRKRLIGTWSLVLVPGVGRLLEGTVGRRFPDSDTRIGATADGQKQTPSVDLISYRNLVCHGGSVKHETNVTM
jgi:hypothetical protein